MRHRAGVLIDRFGAYTQIIIVTAIALLVALAFVRRIAPDLPHESESKPKFQLTFKPMPYVVGLVALFSMVPEGAILDWGALYLRQDLGADVTYSGLAFGAVAATMALMRFAGDAVRQRFGRRCDHPLVGHRRGHRPGHGRTGQRTGHGNHRICAFRPRHCQSRACCPLGGWKPARPAARRRHQHCHLHGYSGILLAPALIGFVAEYNGFSIAFMGLAALFVVVLLLSSVARHADLIGAEAAAAGE